MSAVIVEACSYFRPTLKPTYCKCGAHRRDHSEEALASVKFWTWGWRSRLLAQPDREECE